MPFQASIKTRMHCLLVKWYKINSMKHAIKKSRSDHSDKKYARQDMAPPWVLFHEGFGCPIIKHQVSSLFFFRRNSTDFPYPMSPHGLPVCREVWILREIPIKVWKMYTYVLYFCVKWKLRVEIMKGGQDLV